MNKNRLILILGILTLVTPFLGIPNGMQDWLIAIYGLALVFMVLFEYFSVKNHSHDKRNDDEEAGVEYDEEVTEPTFEENGFEEVTFVAESDENSSDESESESEAESESESESEEVEERDEEDEIDESEDDRIR